ncbi:MAG: inositol monophosphatase [Planctomycetota bacterium]|nr:inositol monophosphatase [Planctomycetota bacterium]
MNLSHLVSALHTALPPAVRWSGSVARRMRQFNIALEDKKTGSSNTDALTLADLSVQELLVGALRDSDPALRQCRIQAEETTGDLTRFATESPYTIALDPIDGTKQYRDKTGNGYSIILTLRSNETLHYTLVFVPESGSNGAWVEVFGDRVVCGADDPARTAGAVLASLPVINRATWDKTPAGTGKSKKIYMIGFQKHDRTRAELVSQTGLEGVAADDCPGCPYELIASGQYAGSLIHSPNIYDFPASLHIARVLGGESLWVHNRQPVHFGELWMDERAKMLRLPGIVATSPDRKVLDTLCSVARDWNPVRYAD